MPSRSAERLLLSMRSTASGWRAGDLARLYLGFGFYSVTGSKHTIDRHPSYPELIATVSRSSGELPPGYIRDAVRLIDELRAAERDMYGQR